MVRVLTQKKAAGALKVSRHEVAKRLLEGSLTSATVDDRPAVLLDAAFRKLERAARKVAA